MMKKQSTEIVKQENGNDENGNDENKTKCNAKMFYLFDAAACIMKAAFIWSRFSEYSVCNDENHTWLENTLKTAK